MLQGTKPDWTRPGDPKRHEAQRRRKKLAADALDRRRSLDACRTAFLVLRWTTHVVLVLAVAVNARLLHRELHHNTDPDRTRSPVLRIVGNMGTRAFAVLFCSMLTCVEADWRALSDHFRVLRRSPVTKALLYVYVSLITASNHKPLQEFSLANLAAWLLMGAAGFHVIVGTCFQRTVDEALRNWKKRDLAKKGKRLRKRGRGPRGRSPNPSEHGSDASLDTGGTVTPPPAFQQERSDVGYMPEWARGGMDERDELLDNGFGQSYQFGGVMHEGSMR